MTPVFIRDWSDIMKNKKVYVILIVLILIGSIFLTYNIYQNKNKVIKTKKNKQNNLAIMIKEDGATDYTKSNSKDIPKGNYVLNRDKSYCKNNGKIGNYDSSLGKVSFLFIGTDSCFLYFDYKDNPPEILNVSVTGKTLTADLTDDNNLSGYAVNTSNVTPSSWTNISGKNYKLNITISTPGTYYLWVKDNSDNITKYENIIINKTASDIIVVKSETNYSIVSENGLRYEGASPDNYICLDNNESGSCSNTNLLFRIIGLFEEEYSLDRTNSAGKISMIKVIKPTHYATSYWHSSRDNDWTNSDIKKALNETYLTELLSLNSNIENKILNAKWYLGAKDNSDTSDSNYTVTDYYSDERSTDYILYNRSAYAFAKVGLLYPSDWGYAAIYTKCSRSWSMNVTGYGKYTGCDSNNWLGYSRDEWLLTPQVSYDASAAIKSTYRYVDKYNITAYKLAYRPVLYLDASYAMIGSGTESNPYRLV